MKAKVKVLKRIKAAIDKINKLSKLTKNPGSVKVGLPKGSNNYPDGTSVIMVGAVHEFGSPKRNIPQRSFLRTTVVEKRKEYAKLQKKLLTKIVSGEINEKTALDIIGLKVQTDVQQKIHDIKSPPLKNPSAKRGKEPNPLIDTGHLRQAITYTINK